MKTDKKSPINLVPLFGIQNSKKGIRKNFINTNYKSLKNLNNRPSSLEAYINNCISLSSYDFNNNLISSNEGYLGYQGSTLCLTLVDIDLDNILSNLGIFYNQIDSIVLELEGSFSPYYGDIDIYDVNDDYVDSIDCTDGHNPLEIDIKAIFEQANHASFALIPIEPCSGITLFDSANAYLRINYHPDLSFLSSIGYIKQQLFDKYKEFLSINVKNYSFKIDKSYALPYIDKSLFFLRGKHLPIDLHLKYVYEHHFDGFDSFTGFPFAYKSNYHCFIYYNDEKNQYIYEDKDGFVHIFELAKNSSELYFDNSGTGLMLEFRNSLPVIFDEEGNYQKFDHLGRLYKIHEQISETHYAELDIKYEGTSLRISSVTDNYHHTIDFIYSSDNVSIYYQNNIVVSLNSIDNELRTITKYSDNQEVDTIYYGTTSTYIFSNLLSFALSSGQIVAFTFNRYIPTTSEPSNIYQYDSLNKISTNIEGQSYEFSYQIEDHDIKSIAVTDNKNIKTTFTKSNDQIITIGYDNEIKMPYVSVNYKDSSFLIREDFPVDQSLKLDLASSASSNNEIVYSTTISPNFTYQTVNSISPYLQNSINYMFYVELDDHQKLNKPLIIDLYEENYQTSGTFLRASLAFNDNEAVHVFPISKRGNSLSRFYLVISNNSNQALTIKRANIVPLLGKFNKLCSNINYGGPIFYKDEQGHAILNKGLGITFNIPIDDSNTFQMYENDYLINERLFYKKSGNTFNFWANDQKLLVANITSASISLSLNENLIFSSSSIRCVDSYNDSFDVNFRYISGDTDNSFSVNSFSHNSSSFGENYSSYFYEEINESNMGGYQSISFALYNRFYQLLEKSDTEDIYVNNTYDNSGNLTSSLIHKYDSNSYNLRNDYSYDNNDNLTWERDFIGDNVPQHWLYYDNINNLNKEVLPNSSSLEYSYSNNFDKLVSVDFYKNITEYFTQIAFYQNNNLKEEKTSNSTYSYFYNENGEISSIKYNNQPIVTFTYSYTNDVDSKIVTYSNGYSYSESYDRFGRLLTSDKLTYSYNSYSLISEINDTTNSSPSSKISYSYNYYNEITDIVNAYNGLSITINYDSYLRKTNDLFKYQNSVIYQNNYVYYQKRGLEKVIKSSSINLTNLSLSINIDENVDVLSRPINQSLFIGSNGIKKEISYYNYSYLGGGTTETIHTVSYQNILNNATNVHLLETYSYDLLGNISQISFLQNNATSLTKYRYDKYSRLIREDNELLNKTYVYSYDSDGNIIEKKEYYYCSSRLLANNFIKTYSYSYDSNYPTRLVSFDNQTITYDNLGNPLTYRGAVLTWNRGTLLSSYTKDGVSININYDGFGLLKSKMVGTSITAFNYVNGLLLLEIRGTDIITYLYSNKDIIGFAYHNVIYYYEKNIQNDVIAIRDINHNIVASYIYDAFGNHQVTNPDGSINTSSSFIGNINPIRYRSYYYDTDLKMYWLTTRYYDPEVGRFISPDYYSYLDYEDFHGLNLYCYCYNNPANYIDIFGHEAVLISIGGAAIVVSLFVFAAICVLAEPITDLIGDISEKIGDLALQSRNSEKEEKDKDKTRKGNGKVAPRNKSNTKKEAKEKAFLKGGKKKPIHHPHGKYGPHFHPNNPKFKHWHYYYTLLLCLEMDREENYE